MEIRWFGKKTRDKKAENGAEEMRAGEREAAAEAARPAAEAVRPAAGTKEPGAGAREAAAGTETGPDSFAGDEELEALLREDNQGKKKKKRRLPRFRKPKKKTLIIGAIALAGLFGVSRLMGGGKSQAIPANTVTPQRALVQEKLSVSGPISGTDSVDVVSNLHAEITKLSVAEGDRVEAGQVLAELDDTEIRKEAEMAKNDYDLAVITYDEKNREARSGYEKAMQDYETAQNNYNRMQALFDIGGIPQVDLETARNAMNDARRQAESFTIKDGAVIADESYRLQIEKARFDYEQKLEQLEDTKIKAPISGTVVRVNTKVGRFADKTDNSAEPLFVIENLDVLEMEIQVSEYSIGKVAVGQDVLISADILNGRTVNGQVVAISPTGEEKSGGSTERVIPTTIRILDHDTNLIAGINARAEIILEEAENALSVPAAAVIERDGVSYVLAARNGTVHWLPVEIGVEGDILTEVSPKEGETLDETTAVLSSPSENYAEGMAVTAIAR